MSAVSEKTIAVIKKLLKEKDGVVFAYMHGSAVSSETYHDIDIGLYIENDMVNTGKYNTMDYIIPAEQNLEKEIGVPVDIQILNTAPLSFRYSVVTHGIVLIDTNPLIRERFELMARVHYFDFRPKAEEYLREALR